MVLANIAMTFFVFFSTLSHSFADNCLRDLTGSNTRMSVVFAGFEGAGGPERQSQLEASAAQISSDLEHNLFAHLNVPKKLRLRFKNRLVGMPFNRIHVSHCINGFDVCLTPDHGNLNGPLTPENMIPDLTHEIGHAVFKINIGAYIDHFLRYTKVHAALVEAPRQNLFESSYVQTSVEKALNLPGEFKFESAYEELFADVLAVLMTNKSNAISVRDFSNVADARTWAEEEAHMALTPVRNYLWLNVLRDLPKSERSRFVADLFHVIAREVADRWNDDKIRKMEIAEANLRLIQKLSEHFNLPPLGEPARWYQIWRKPRVPSKQH